MCKSLMKFYLKNNFRICSEIRIKNEKILAMKIKWIAE